MTFSASSVIAAIPSPGISTLSFGPVTVHIYALCIMAGIVVAALLTNHRLTRRDIPITGEDHR